MYLSRTHNTLQFSSSPLNAERFYVFLKGVKSLPEGQASTTKRLLLEGVLLGYDWTKTWDNTRPREPRYNVREQVAGLQTILEKVKTHKMAISRERHYEDGYLASIFFAKNK